MVDEPAVILSLSKINTNLQTLEGRAVRTYGRIESFDVVTCHLRISNESAFLSINTTLVPDFNGKTGNIGQFIGDISDGKLNLKSYQEVSDIDLKLLWKVLEKRELYLNNTDIQAAWR